VTGELTYGVERLAMYLQGVESIFDITWTMAAGTVSYGDVFQQNEVEQSRYNFELADTVYCCAASMSTRLPALRCLPYR